jgi:TRAP-type C4-dicarboxylate transport system substrate-binding protein
MKSLALALVASVVWFGPASAQEKLILVTASPAGGDNSQHYAAWGKKVTAESQGALDIDVRDGTSLANFANVLDRVGNDVIQIGWMLHGQVGGKFPLTETTTLPFVVDDVTVGSVAMWRLYKSGALASEYADTVPLYFGYTGINMLHFAKAPKAPDDLHGLKVRVVGKPQSQTIELLGGAALAMPPQDMYDGLRRGVLDAALTPWSAFAPFKLHEVTSYHTEVPLGATVSMQFMMKKKYDSLPAAGRKALEDNGLEAESRRFGAYLNNQGVEQRVIGVAQANNKIVQLPPERIAMWKDKVSKAVVTEWVKDHPGADKILDAYGKLYAEVKAGR